ncbi:MAG: M15 family metallopeptidase [Treponema sp.]|nr:M15 family metallopeptidase [Treponema sp.]
MNKKIIITLIIFILANFNSCGGRQVIQASETNDPQPVEETAAPEPTRAERVMRALHEAFPNQIVTVEFRNDDWALLLRNLLQKETWYYYAEGRLLPEDKREQIANYRSVQFYNYPEELPEWKASTNEETTRYQSWTSNRRQNTASRSSFFLDDLWQSYTREGTNSMQAAIRFLGKPTKVHRLIEDKMLLVEAQILEAAKTNSEIQTWINNLGSIEGWGWRNIAQTQSRSYHSYGLAVDLLPRNLGGKQTYWLWTSQYREDWWNVSYNERYHPPAPVIKIFEANGFIWGGKWPMFDTMHFEYRPEVLILNGLYKR